jgi:hypothetical protein
LGHHELKVNEPMEELTVENYGKTWKLSKLNFEKITGNL